MTGNNKVWRAPVAGLASAAMLATLGVGAMTANASESAPTYKVSFTVKNVKASSSKLEDGAIEVTAGDSLADALQGYSTGVSFAGMPEKFVGWKDASGAYYDFDAPVTGDVALTADLAATDDAVLVKFSTTDGLSFPDATHAGEYYVRQGQPLADQRKPVDVADGKLIVKWDVEGTEQSDLTVNNVNDPADGTFDIAPSANGVETNVPQLTIKGNTDGYVIGAKSDGANDTNYVVDVLKDESFTVPSWVSVNVNPSVYPQGWVVEGTSKTFDGATPTVTVDEAMTLIVNEKTVEKTVTVKFNDASGKTIASATVPFENGMDYGYLPAGFDVPAVPEMEGFVAKGWKLDSGTIADSDAPANGIYTADDFDTVQFKSDAVFVPFQGGFTTEIKVTFKDVDYRGNNDSVVVTVNGGTYLDASQAPEWTRDGYILAGWTKDGNTPYDFDTLIGGTDKDFTLTAMWVKASNDILDAALAYINPDNNEYKDYFTTDSYTAFKSVYDGVLKDKKAAEYNSSDSKVSDEVAADLVSQLRDGWEDLVFNHSADGTENGGYSVVHRLNQNGDHFYTQDPNEVKYLTSTLNNDQWVDEGRLFLTIPRSANQNWDSDLEALSSFDRAAGKVVDGVAVADLASKLDEVADPIVEAVYRVYNKANGDHVWTVDAHEYEVLSSGADWNAEGTAFYVPVFGDTTVTRLYGGNRHLLSTDSHEAEVLAQNGWNNEGVAFRAY